MKQFCEEMTNINYYIRNCREPDFNNLLKVLKKEKPDRPTLFEFFLNDDLYKKLTCGIKYDESDEYAYTKRRADAFRIAGYDYVTMIGSDFSFESKRHMETGKASVSLNEGTVISDRESFERYDWPDPNKYDYSRFDVLSEYMPEKMKIIAYGPDGVLETVVKLVGYENLCYMVSDDPELAQDVFDAVGSRFARYYEICAGYDSVGALISNDDWGFNTQTFLSANDMRKYVIPWHKKIVEIIHASGKPAILHSCGMLDSVMDDIIDEIKYDAKHSYEDNICPIEAAYEKYGSRIALLGGIDVGFICTSTPEEVYKRSAALLERTGSRGGHAHGSGNSIPYYVPQKNYLAMIAAALW